MQLSQPIDRRHDCLRPKLTQLKLEKPQEACVLITQDSTLFDLRPGADNLGSALATHNDASVLQTVASMGDLGFTGASIARISAKFDADQ